METKMIVSWLYDKAARAHDHSYARMLNMTAKRLRELDEKQRWIPVTERLPEPETDVLIFCGGNIDILTYRYDRHGNVCFMFQNECGYWKEVFGKVTHWMPLPEAPKEVER